MKNAIFFKKKNANKPGSVSDTEERSSAKYSLNHQYLQKYDVRVLHPHEYLLPTAEKVAAKLKKPVINIKFGSRTENS